MKNFEKAIKRVVVLCLAEIIVLSFSILYGIENGFELWNWLTIIIVVLTYLVFTATVIVKENKGTRKLDRSELTADDYQKEQAKNILKVIDQYLKDHQKAAYDLRLYWPFYKSLLKKIAHGKKIILNQDYGFLDQLKLWQFENQRDDFLLSVYDCISSCIIDNKTS